MFRNYIFYLKNDQTCSVIHSGYASEDCEDCGKAIWMIRHDSLLIVQKDNKLKRDTAFYKIAKLTSDKLTITLIKRLKDDYNKLYTVPYHDKDFNNNPLGDETTFHLEEYLPLDKKFIVGDWSVPEASEGFFSWTFSYGDTCSSYRARPVNRGGMDERKGTWKLQDNLLIVNWTGGNYAAIEISFDTLHVIRLGTFNLEAKELTMRRDYHE